tara:strand:+ start:40 stop:762 length:723 start_codon:yes stop_codon:yes gene_type:complete
MTFEQALKTAIDLLRPFLDSDDLALRVTRLNQARAAIGQSSPFAGEPVDGLQWVPAGEVYANDYNPNAVAPPEMALLEVSIKADGFTQPIVTFAEDACQWTVVDGFHRNRVGKECDGVAQRLFGYLPIVTIQESRSDEPDRMAATIRHNRARGKHKIDGMSAIVLALKRRNWSDKKIGTELGMDPDEVLRLAQITGLAEAFKDREFSLAWEPEIVAQDEDNLEEICAGSDSPTTNGKTTK